ncbi:hypothetical protein CAAN1_07S01156 [[Candida] anglica]|uniref:HIT-type domain-containing protein n=1 Tax=[Candida] anglica TaxID=148631 RepID=A0ABP0EDQ4_9ASCO
MLVEEIPKASANKGSTIYFSSSINLTARPPVHERQIDLPQESTIENGNGTNNKNENANRLSKNRPKVNYNLTYLMNAQTQANDSNVSQGQLKSSQQIQLERLISRRLNEINKENGGGNSNFELPKNFADSRNLSGDKKKSRLGNTPSTKKILSARRTLASYFEEERNVLSINSILSLNYQFLEELDPASDTQTNKRQKTSGRSVIKPKLRLCCICGSDSSYTRCDSCGLFACSVRCNKSHLESRCV